MENTQFANWLITETEKRDWSYRELGRRAEISASTISKVISGASFAGPDFCTGIARAFGLPADVVFRKAGLLPPEPKETVTSRELVYMFLQLDEEAQERMLQIARAFLDAKKERVIIGGEKPAST